MGQEIQKQTQDENLDLKAFLAKQEIEKLLQEERDRNIALMTQLQEEEVVECKRLEALAKAKEEAEKLLLEERDRNMALMTQLQEEEFFEGKRLETLAKAKEESEKLLQEERDRNMALMTSLEEITCEKDTLLPGEILKKGEFIRSENTAYKAVMQDDGNFVVYGHDSLWASNTQSNGDRVVMQHDGNLVVYNKDTPTWASDTWSRGHRLVMQSDGNLVVYNALGSQPHHAVWASNTNGRY